jgi:hypothetical protein
MLATKSCLPASTAAASGLDDSALPSVSSLQPFVANVGQRGVAGLLCDTWQVVCDVFRLQNQLPDAARIAIRLGDQVPRSTH